MTDQEMSSFIKLVVSAIQTNHNTSQECKKALTIVLEEADRLYITLTGEAIVKRGDRTILDALTSHQLTKIS